MENGVVHVHTVHIMYRNNLQQPIIVHEQYTLCNNCTYLSATCTYTHLLQCTGSHHLLVERRLHVMAKENVILHSSLLDPGLLQCTREHACVNVLAILQCIT